MTSRRQVLLAVAGALVVSSRANGQIRASIPRVGLGSFGDMPGPNSPPEPIVVHLERLGYVEGKTIVYERRYARGSRDAFPALVGALLAANVDVIYAAGSDMARAFRSRSLHVAVVFTVSDNPVAAGLVQSFAKPGGMFTGVSLMSPELADKRLELLKATLPALRRVAVLHDPEHRASYVRDMEAAARMTSVDLLAIPFSEPSQFPAAFDRATRADADAMFVEPSRFTLAYAHELAALAVRYRMPAISAYDTFARAGGLMSYGPRIDEAAMRAAAQIDRLLKGARPADVPVEQPTRIAFVLNTRTAAALGLAIPQAVLVRADELLQ